MTFIIEIVLQHFCWCKAVLPSRVVSAMKYQIDCWKLFNLITANAIAFVRGKIALFINIFWVLQRVGWCSSLGIQFLPPTWPSSDANTLTISWAAEWCVNFNRESTPDNANEWPWSLPCVPPVIWVWVLPPPVVSVPRVCLLTGCPFNL